MSSTTTQRVGQRQATYSYRDTSSSALYNAEYNFVPTTQVYSQNRDLQSSMSQGSDNFTIVHYAPFDLCQKLIERLKMCRDSDCFSACWIVNTKGDSHTIAITAHDRSSVALTIQPPQADGPPVTVVKTSLNKFYDGFRLTADPLHDTRQFEEIFSFLHHLKFGMCQIKNSAASAPLGRLDQIEAYVNDLKEVCKSGEVLANK